MDPICALCDFLEADSDNQRMDVAEAWRAWRARGGFAPLVAHVRGEWEKRGHRWTRRHHALALMFGAV